MSLPGGYTELEYIQSSGTQYVDTGLNPNQDFGVTIDFQMTTVSGWQCIFGAANSAQNADEYGVWHNGTNFGFYYASTNVTVSAEATARHLFVCSKNTITVRRSRFIPQKSIRTEVWYGISFRAKMRLG